MKRSTLLIALLIVMSVVAGAQQRAPQNESIRQENLKADLFFVAGDSLTHRTSCAAAINGRFSSAASRRWAS